MRISKLYKLGASQFQLDFLDINTSRDLPLFIDPHVLGQRTDRWSLAASTSIQCFFRHFLDLLRAGKKSEARRLFSPLGEPNETCLGLSRGAPRGSGIGEGLADAMFDSLSKSKAVTTGVLTDLEDAQIFVPGIGKDRVSDMATGLIRGQLLQYTIDQCGLWGISLTNDVPSGDIWDSATATWINRFLPRLVIKQRPILLVPKGIVSFSKGYTHHKYHRAFVLKYLQSEHLRMNTVLVQQRRRRDGSIRRWVTKKSLIAHESPGDKEYLAEFTERHVEVFADFKARAGRAEQSLADEEFTTARLDEVVAHLKAELDNVLPGNAGATRYHRVVTGILELCFYPSLINPRQETPLHDGRKRIDITFDNAAPSGFFHRLHDVHELPCAYIMVECKNYSRDVNNPELDQLAGRFSVNRGRVGLLLSRAVNDLDTLLLRCADAYKDGRGLLIPIIDSDLLVMLENRLAGAHEPFESILANRTRQIAML